MQNGYKKLLIVKRAQFSGAHDKNARVRNGTKYFRAIVRYYLQTNSSLSSSKHFADEYSSNSLAFTIL